MTHINPFAESAREREIERDSGEHRPSAAEILDMFDRIILLAFSRSDALLVLEAMGGEWRLEFRRVLDEFFRAKTKVEQADLVATAVE